MSAVNPNPMEKSMVLVLVDANAGGGRHCYMVSLASSWQEKATYKW
jgi:hypothetical protein